ncbi:class I SAM-dependent methyltransferase [Streptomyces sp. M10(2022)]
MLELGVGTGRVALPLARRGFDVHGVEASEAMAARLRAKPGGATSR